ncbi:MAG: type II toxin-antitoxin system RelE/ParE family toxin [Porticoccaceae bacterium]
MAQVIWTEPALDNLDDIAEYIALSNPPAASDLVQRGFYSIDRLAQFHQSGRIPGELSEFNYREVVVNPVRVFYKFQKETIYILFVLRQERDLRRYILESPKTSRAFINCASMVK